MEMSAKINILYTDYVHSEEEVYPLNLLKTVWENDKTLIHDADGLLQRLLHALAKPLVNHGLFSLLFLISYLLTSIVCHIIQ